MKRNKDKNLSARILVFTAQFMGNKTPNLYSKIFDEYQSLAKKVKLLVFSRKAQLKNYDNIKLVQLPEPHPPFWSFKAIMGSTRVMFKHRKEFDIVFSRMLSIHPLFPGIIAKILFGKKLVVWVSGSSFTTRELKNFFNLPIIKIALIIGDVIAAPSERVIQDIEKNLGRIDRRKVQVLQKTINISNFHPTNDSSYGTHLLSVCRISMVKGIEKTIKSIPLVAREIPQVKLKIVGPVEDEKYYGELKKLMRNLKCEKNVEFVGPVPNDELVKHYNSSKIFVLTSITEGLPNSMLEAMACGKPVIVTPVGAIADVIENESNGVLIDNPEPEILADKIIEILKDKSLQKKLGINARKTIEEKFSNDDFESQLAVIFKRLRN